MIKLKSLICENDENWNRWVRSMVSTVEEQMAEENIETIDVGWAYDIIKSSFRADAPDRGMFDLASKQAIDILNQREKIQ